MHCVKDTNICDARDGDCTVECEANSNNPTTNICDTNDAGCCESVIHCPVQSYPYKSYIYIYIFMFHHLQICYTKTIKIIHMID